ARFWLATAGTAVAAGLLGVLMMIVLRFVEHRAYGFHTGSFESGVQSASGSRRLLVLAVAGLFTGAGWYVVRRLMRAQNSDLDDALWAGEGLLSIRRSLASSTLSEIAVGAGASLGREAAPKLLGAASGSLISRWAGLSPAQRRLLVACGGGAGVAAIYNVPLGGALLAAEVLYGSLTLPVVLPALVSSAVATIVAWIYLPNTPTYLHVPSYHIDASLVVWSVPSGLLIGILTVVYIRLIGAVSAHRPQGWRLVAATTVVFAALGLVGLHYPQILGNGRDLAAPTFLGIGSLGLLAALAALKPLATVACVGSGASGGLLTPTLATGAALGGFLGLAWTHLWSGAPAGAFALVGAAAMLSAGLQAPLTGLVLMVEFTGTGTSVIVPMLIAAVLATTVARYVDGYSIYSVRLPAVPIGASADVGPEGEPDRG
ncbi:MAG TPA: chloride channel protein, partial [Mycobacteriales bacterium]|nr:chloride channel protein [Mycobacteriales bacterium]